MEKTNKKTIVEYERPRCKVIIELPFGLFIARRIRIQIADVSTKVAP